MKIRRIFSIIVLLTLSFSFNVFAMSANNNEYVIPTPENEIKHEDRSLNYRWTWISDDKCVQFKLTDNAKKAVIQRYADNGLIRRWAEPDGKGELIIKTRETYSGMWLQAENGTWSFEFDDCTIPVGVTKIDDVLYAFNTYGELVEGYEYYDGLTTGADGVVNSDNPEFLAWLETQYVPACTSHE